MPVFDACATDARGLLTCVRDLVDRRFDLPGEVTQQAAPIPAALPRPDPRPFRAEAPTAAPVPVAVAETVPDAVEAEVIAQGGPYIPPTPERIADLQPVPVTPRPSPAAEIAPQPPADSLPLAGRDGVGGAPVSVPPTNEHADVLREDAPPAQLAAGPEWLPDAPPPSIAAPMALAPTIDVIELDGARSVVSGSGPAGALMRLFADDEVVGESEVEEGRWLVETGPLLTTPSQELKIEAIDRDTGRSIGHTVITVEIQLPAGDGPVEPAPAPAEPDSIQPNPVAPQSSAPKPDANLTAQVNPPPRIIVRAPKPEPDAEPEAETAPAPRAAAEAIPVAPPAEKRKLPGLRAVTPQRGSASVTILGPPDGSPSTSFLTID